MNPFKVLHIKKQANLKGRARQKELDDKHIAALKEKHLLELKRQQNQFAKELESVKSLETSKAEDRISHLRSEITRLQEEHKINILEIRKQEKDYYDPLIKEKNTEIANMQIEKTENKKYYENILNYGIMMENSSVQALDIFKRAEMKITEFMNYMGSAEKAYSEAIQLINTGKSKIEYTQNQIEKERPKLIKGLKE